MDPGDLRAAPKPVNASELRAALEARFDAAVAAARSERAPGGAVGAGGAGGGWPPMRLPPIVRETIVAAAGLDASAAEALAAYYCEKMPRLAIDQQRAVDETTRLLHRPLDLARLPRLAAALDGLCSALQSVDLDPPALLGAATPAELLATRPTIAALFAPSLHGPGLPLLGAYPAEREVIARDLRAAREDAVIDLRLSGTLLHELCHGPCREVNGEPPPWMIIEAAAIHLGFTAFRRHYFPDEPAEAVPSLSLFVLVGEALVRRFGRRALWSISFGAPLAEAFGLATARVLAAAGWEDWLRRRHPPFVNDALAAESWIKLIDASRAASAPSSEAGVLARAGATPWSSLPWWSDEPTVEDEAFVEPGVRALFQVNVLAPNLQTHPAELPGGRLALDVPECRLVADPRPEGAFAEPARWLFPPPLARRLHERGARRVEVAGATRADIAGIAAMLVEVALGSRPLADRTELHWARR